MRRTLTSLTLLFALAPLACEDTPTEPTPPNEVPAVSAVVLPGGNGVQKIVGPLSCAEAPSALACRGALAAPPFFPGSDTPFTVKTGTWITLGFSIRSCADAPVVDEAYRGDILDFLLTDIGFSWSLDGEELPVEESVRFDATVFSVDTNFCEPGAYVAETPVRYFVAPQRPGTYEFVVMLGGVGFSRDLTWAPPGRN